MLRILVATVLASALIQTPASAQSAPDAPPDAPQSYDAPQAVDYSSIDVRQRIGHGRLFTNDFLGDTNDRWRTGSITVSRAWSRQDWSGRAPTAFGDLLELRTMGEIIAPEDLINFDPTDRPWAGKLAIGLHTHWTRGPMEFALGGEIGIVGPQTRLSELQKVLHDISNTPKPSDAVIGRQIGNTIAPSVISEIGRAYDLGARTRLRPFAELRAGDESLARFGADLTFGHFGDGELMVRDPVTGQRLRVARDPVKGVSFILGGDVARVFDSIYLPSSRGFELTETRNRVRAGVHWQGESKSIFYGATWLDKEFVGQTDTQVVGSVRIQFQF